MGKKMKVYASPLPGLKILGPVNSVDFCPPLYHERAVIMYLWLSINHFRSPDCRGYRPLACRIKVVSISRRSIRRVLDETIFRPFSLSLSYPPFLFPSFSVVSFFFLVYFGRLSAGRGIFGNGTLTGRGKRNVAHV